jgi:uncharacterized protein YegP (UPF0339 family)
MALLFKVRETRDRGQYWFEIIASSGQILAASGRFATYESAVRIIDEIRSGAAQGNVVDLTLTQAHTPGLA